MTLKGSIIMANSKKLVTLEQLNIVKGYVDAEDAKSIKSGDYADNTIKLYTTEDKSGTPAITVSLPEEIYLDRTKTTFVDSFTWSETAYPGSSDPSLDGKPVLVFAVKDDSGVNYSFMSLEKLVDTYSGTETNSVGVTVTGGSISADIRVSAETGNTVVVKDDGIFVPEAVITCATDDEVRALFTTA